MNSKTHMGHTARKRFGQNFLNDDFIISKIVAAINPQPGENLVEIGPGLGAITKPVLSQTDHLTVVELDRDLADRLVADEEIGHKITVCQGDALKYDFGQLANPEKPMKVFGNLPYNISTPLLFHLFEFAPYIKNMHFMLQKEVVERMVAGPGSKAWGRLSVMTQYFCDAVPVIDVPPESFVPPPKVNSAVIRLTPKTDEQRKLTDTKVLNRVCLEAFNQRRKTVRNCFKHLIPVDVIESIGIDPGIRPESISLNQFIELANWLVDNPSK